MKTLYEKRGRRYVPVAERDTYDAWPQGSHLVVCKPGSRVVRFNIDPDQAALMAAVEPLRDRIADIVMAALAMKPSTRPITPKQRAAWAELERAMGKDRFCLEYNGARGVADEVARVILESSHDPR